jgi:hypothetical protein
VASVGACGSEPESVGVNAALGSIWSAQDTACTTLRLSTAGTADGKTISLAGAPLSCGPDFYTSTSGTGYGKAGCDGYVVELTGVASLPRTGETMRVADGVNPKALLTMSRTQCDSLWYRARAYVHTGLGWSQYGDDHEYMGKWNTLRCELVPGPLHGEIPLFPAAVRRDKIRVVVQMSSNGQQFSVTGGVKLGTCPPTPKAKGAICDSDDECVSGLCSGASCCGSTDKEKALCWQS